MTETGWLADPIGRINNLSLAPSTKNALQPFFEALMNSIHAIEERFGKDNLSKGEIEVELTKNEQGSFTGFVISDNGIGLNKENMISFRKSDSMKKVKFGGKGVGRLLWLKVAERVNIASTYFEDGKHVSIEFDFIADPKTPISDLRHKTENGKIGTQIRLSPLRIEYINHLPAKLDTIAVRTVAHFINYFVNIDCPKITIFDNKNSIDLFEKFSADFVRDKEYSISIEADGTTSGLKLNCFLVPKNYSDDEKSTNGLFFGAHDRAVNRYDMDKVIGLKAINNQYAFFGYLEGELLNSSVNDTRTEFSLGDDRIDSLKRLCIEKIQAFLEKEISEIREQQLQSIVAVRNEHLRFFNIAKNPEEIAKKLSLSTQKDEDIFVEMSRQQLRKYKKAKREFSEAKKNDVPDIEKRAKEYVASLQGESLSSLAEYVYKRKLILDTFEQKTEFADIDAETAHYEKVVHELICPLGSTKDDLEYEDHNLWIIDDRLAFYSYFNSDKQLKKQAETENSRRPDITLFDLGMGFEKASSMEPITIIEFKRPHRDDYSMADNPFNQVQDYVEELKKAGIAKNSKGKTIRSIEPNTPFMCQIIADETPSLKNVMNRLGGFYKKAGSQSYYKWDENYKTFIEVASYSDMIAGAKARHAAFFDKLGITP